MLSACFVPHPQMTQSEYDTYFNTFRVILRLPFIHSWFGQLEKTMWMQHLSGLLGAAMTVVHTIEKNGRPVLVHCSDGWDRTPQIVATAQLCLDPYYRTVEV